AGRQCDRWHLSVRLGYAPRSFYNSPKKMMIKRIRAHRNPKACMGPKGGAFVTSLRDTLARELTGTCLHIGVIRTVASLWGNPGNVLSRVFHVTGFAVDAVLRVDLKSSFAALGDHLIDLRGAIALRWLGIFRQVLGNRDARVGECEMHRLILGMVGA